MASVGREQLTDATELISIDALGLDGTYRTRNREPVATTAGVAVAELSMVPPLYVSRDHQRSTQRSTVAGART